MALLMGKIRALTSLPSTKKCRRSPECINGNAYRCTLLLRVGFGLCPPKLSPMMTPRVSTTTMPCRCTRGWNGPSCHMVISSQCAFSPNITRRGDCAYHVGRNAPHKFEAHVNSADGMFSKKNIMVFLRHLASDDKLVCTWY